MPGLQREAKVVIDDAGYDSETMIAVTKQIRAEIDSLKDVCFKQIEARLES